MILLAGTALAALLAAPASPAEMKALTAEDLVRIKRVTDPQVSPDGRYVAYVLRETDIGAARMYGFST